MPLAHLVFFGILFVAFTSFIVTLMWASIYTALPPKDAGSAQPSVAPVSHRSAVRQEARRASAETAHQSEPSRRAVLHSAALVVGFGGVIGASLFARPAAAAAKMKRQDAGYQPMPSGSARCDGCLQWQAPHDCKVVDGVISPSGWCTLYAPKR